jgi:hypothetical protein
VGAYGQESAVLGYGAVLAHVACGERRCLLQRVNSQSSECSYNGLQNHLGYFEPLGGRCVHNVNY